jgi:phosphoglycolate phosphatase
MLITEQQLYIFDFDGTLADTSADILASINYLRKHYALPPLSFTEARKYIGIGQTKLIEGFLAEVPELNLSEATRLFREHHESQLTNRVKLYPGTAETLQSMFAQGKKLAIVSNKYSFYVEKILNHLQARAYFSLILGPDNVEKRKPDPLPLFQTAEKLKIALTKTVMVGDSRYDIEVGKNAGVTTVACTYGFNTRAELAVYQPDYYIDKFSELIGLYRLFSFSVKIIVQ